MFFDRVDPIARAADAYGSQLRQELSAYPTTERSVPLPDVDGWPWVFAAEAEVLRRLPGSEVRRRAWLIYDRFTDVAGAEKAAKRAAANTLNIDTCDVEDLRADLLQVQSETARIYTLSFEVERERGLLTGFITRISVVAFAALVVVTTLPTFIEVAQWIIGGVAGLVVLGLIAYAYYRRRDRNPPTMRTPPGIAVAMLVLVLCVNVSVAGQEKPETGTTPTPVERKQPEETKSPDMPIGPLVALAGILGATFSILQRAQRSAVGTDPATALFNLRAARRQAYLSIISGAIAALVVFCVFAGGMVQGSIFPMFVNKFTHGPDVRFPMKLFDFFEYTGPQTHTDHGKLLVWCFIAGFAERFVPDMLDRFAASAKK